MSKFELYLLTRLDGIQELFAGIAIASGIFIFFAIILGPLLMDSLSDYIEEPFRKTASWVKRLVFTAAICGLISVSIPSTKDLAIIYGLNYITNNEEAQKLPDNVLKTINKQLEEWQREDKE